MSNGFLHHFTNYPLEIHRAHRMRVCVFGFLIFSFYEGAAITPKVIPEFWNPVGPAGPLLNYLFVNWGGDFLVQLQNAIRPIGYLAALVSMIGYRPQVFSKIFAAVVLLSLSLFFSTRGIRHSDLPLVISSLLAAMTTWPGRNSEFRETVDLWPIHLQRFLFAYVFVSSGTEKLIHNGASWIWGTVAWETVQWTQLGYAHRFPTELQLAVNHAFSALSPATCRIFGIVVILLEICTPPLLYFRRTQPFAFTLLVSLLVGFRLVLFVPFSGFYCLIVYWLPYFNPAEKRRP